MLPNSTSILVRLCQRPAQLLFAALLLFTAPNGSVAQSNLNRIEYYIDKDPGFGNATVLNAGSGTDLSDLTIPITTAGLSDGVHRLYARARNSAGWGMTNTWLFYKPYSSTDGGVQPSVTNISRVEYFIDTDPGIGAGTSLTISAATTLQDLVIPINPGLLAEGVHRIYVRALSGSGWSMVNTLLFYKPYAGTEGGVQPQAGSILKLEYYIDTDPGIGNATSLTFTAGTNLADLIIPINTALLADGVHRLYVRAQNSNGWSMTNSWLFYRPYGGIDAENPLPPPNLKRLEYFVDTDPGYGKAIPVSIQNTDSITDLLVAVDLSGLSVGEHTVNMRALDNNNHWSMVNTLTFDVPIIFSTPAIIITAITQLPTCAADSIKVNFSKAGKYGNSNQFNLELSDASGSFASPVIIGSVTDTAAGKIAGKLPAHVVTGNGYKLRVSSTNPVITGVVNASSISIKDRPQAQQITGSIAVNGNATMNYATIANGSSWQWIIEGGTQITGTTTNNISVQFTQPLAASADATIKAVENNGTGCAADTSLLNITVYKLNISNTPSFANLCKGGNFTIVASVDGAINPGNIYTAQLSDASGSFANPVNIGTAPGNGNGLAQAVNITAVIPAATASGNGFRIRVISNNPAFTGAQNTAPLTIGDGLAAPTASVTIKPGCVSGTGTIVVSKPTGAGITYSIGGAYQSSNTFTGIAAGNYPVTVQNAAGCISSVTNLAVTADTIADVTVTASGPLSFCQGGEVTLTSSAANGNVWSTGATTKSIVVNSSGNYFVTVGLGDCAAISNSVAVTVTPGSVATFAAIASFCSGSQAPLLPGTSLNGITGTWNPAVIGNTSSGTYLFTPSGGECVSAVPLSVVVLPVTTPLFAAIPDIMPGSPAPTLPTISQNGIGGTWSPATVSNIATGSYTFTPAGGQCAAPVTITVVVKVAPDLAVQNVTASDNTISPNDQLTVSWNVANVGSAQSLVNWTEKIYIQSVGGTNRTLLKQSLFSNDGMINISQNIARTDIVSIPSVLSVGDQGVLVVEIVPGDNIPEVAGATANNTGVQQTPLTIRKLLSLELSGNQLTEGASNGITVTVNRTGALTTPLIVNITTDRSQRYTLPITVTIPAGQSVISFIITANENNAIEGKLKDTITASATGFQSVNAGFEVLDNDSPTLTITNLPAAVTEGATVEFRITTNLAPGVPLQVFLNSSNEARFPVPASVTIPAGSLFVNVSVNLVQDNITEVEATLTINAAASNVTAASTSIQVKDDDLPGIELVLQTHTISETAGFFATQATLRRAAGSNPISFTANLSASLPGTLILPPSISLAAGENEKTFTIGVVDNTLVDGERLVNITAAIFVNSCGCSAPPSTAGSVSENITVSDNDGPALQLSALPITLLEGATNAGLLKITRNTPTSQPLLVTLHSSETGEATLPATATIPAGADFVEVPITTINDGVTDGSKQVNFEATATGFSPGTVWILVTDLNKPDLQIPSVTLASNPLQAMTIFNYEVSIKNTGFATAATGVVVHGYLSPDALVDAADSLVTIDTVTSAIAAGQTVQLVNAATVPNLPGEHKLIFKVNPAAAVTELLLTNNFSQPLDITINPDYTATAVVASDYFTKGTAINITGKAIKTNGAVAADVPVEAYVIIQGFKRTITATTDAAGNYVAVFEPLANEAGHYIVGAGYPGTKGTIEQDAFDILGVKINNGTIPQFRVIINDTLRGVLPVENLTSRALTAFTLANVNLPNGAVIRFDTIATFAGNSSASISYRIVGKSLSQGVNFEVAGLRAVSKEGNIQPQDVFYYCQAPNGFLEASITKINLSVSQSAAERLVEFKLINKGSGSTGNVKVNLPALNWLTSVTPVNIAPMTPGDSVLIVLKFSAPAEVPFNFPISGGIGFSSQNGNAFTIPFTFAKVSETTGAVRIIATDQFTYYSDAAPKVEGAHVVVKNYYTGEVYAEGNTGNNGIFEATGVPEGTHKIVVEKEKHLPYTNTITINPGDTVEQTAFLNYQAITFSWTVVPTAIEDEYDITLTTQFETHVPVPIVTIDMPKTMPQLSGNEVYAFNAILINHGLVTAKDVAINLPDGDLEYEFVTNYVPADLLAQQSIQVPIIMRRRSGGGNVGGKPSYGAISDFLGMRPPSNATLAGGASNCQDFTSVVYWYKCNISTGLWQKGGTLFTYSGRVCSSGPGTGIFPPITFGDGGGGTGGYPVCAYCPCTTCGGGSGTTPTPPAATEKKSCVECLNDLAQAILGCFGIDIPPPASCFIKTLIENGGPKSYTICVIEESVKGAIGNAVTKKIGSKIPYLAQLLCLKALLEALETCLNTAEGPAAGKNSSIFNKGELSSVTTQIGDNLKVVNTAYNQRINWNTEYFGDLSLNGGWDGFSPLITPYVVGLVAISATSQDSIINAMNGYEIDPVAMRAFFTRWNKSIEARDLDILEPNAEYPGIINWTLIKSYSDSLVNAHNYAVNKGFASINDMHSESKTSLSEIIDGQKNAVCASVTVQLSQKLTMTREAFEGTLEIFNGHPTDKMDSLTVNIQINDENGVPANGLFEIQTKSLTNLSDVTGTGNIAAQEKGAVKFLFIPEIGAAPIAPKLYNFGGIVRYYDPYAKTMVSLPLAAVQLTVNPSPNLFLHYFLERNILGDDALTSPEIEPSVPAELAVMVENQGYGAAVNMTISSAQPKIVENEKGLAINFKLIGSNFQGQPTNLGVTNINFGTIPPLQTRIGQWYLTSSLLGKFVSYDAKVVHNNSFGNPDLSLVQGVKLHELTKSIKLYGDLEDGINDFLVNDYFDVQDVPDIIYFSQGTRTAKVVEVASSSFSGPVAPPSFTNTLTATAANIGWNYVVLPDPGFGGYELESVTRSDGQVIPLSNAWLTFVTLPVAQQPKYENKFHFVDTFSSVSPITYSVVWKPKNFNVPNITSISGAADVVTATQVQKLTVMFDKAIDASTFTYEDLNLTFQGGPNIITSAVSITPIDSVTFSVDVSSLTTGNGFYNFTAQAANIKDVYGINGLTGKQYTWTQFLTVPTVQAFLGIPDANIAAAYDTIGVFFNLPIDVSTVKGTSFTILKDSVVQSGTIVIDSIRADHKLFYLSGLANILTQNGVYEFRVNLPEIKSESQAFGVQTQSIFLKVDNTGPSIVSMTTSNTGGLDPQHVTFVNIQFDEDVAGFNTSSVTLIRNGEAIPLNIAQLSNSDLKTWMAGNFALLTYPDGVYTFTVNTAGFTDAIGNPGTSSQQITWTVNHASLITISNITVNPDLGFSNTDGITSVLGMNVGFDLSADASTVTISQVDLSGEVVLATINDVAEGRVTLPFMLASGGHTGIRIIATGANGGSDTVQQVLFIDQLALTAAWNFATNQQLQMQVDTIPIVFSARLLSEAGMLAAVQLKRNELPVSTTSLSFGKLNDSTYFIYGLRGAGSLPGKYEISYDLKSFNKYSSGIAGTGSAVASWTLVSTNLPPVANAGADITINNPGIFSLNGSSSYDPENNPISYRWIAPTALVLSDSTSTIPSFNITTANHGSTYSLILIVSDGELFTTDVVTVVVNLTTGIYYRDADGDGYGDPAVTSAGPTLPEGYVTNNTDCVDDPSKNGSNIYPGAPELCNGIDDNCNGQVDEAMTTYYYDYDKDGFGNRAVKKLSCFQPTGYVTDSTDCNDLNKTVYPGAVELCDGLDNNCDKTVDEGFNLTSFYQDFDKDGYGNKNVKKLACVAPPGYIVDSNDCNDRNSATFPGAPELCDGLDNDCDGIIDDGLFLQTFYRDKDKDGYGDVATKVEACVVPPGYVKDSADCNDSKPTVYPGAPEICDALDNNCDGNIDEGFAVTYYYFDTDKDGFGNRAAKKLSCSQPKGYVADSTDCNDLNATVFPGAQELCDGLDNDCDGIIDDGLLSLQTFYRDKDADGYGDVAAKVLACIVPPGYVTNSADCNDSKATVFPGAPEICDGFDNNCDGDTDEGFATTYYYDYDKDGFGNRAVKKLSCFQPTGYVTDSTDCNDLNNTVYPGAVELCDGLDNNCDKTVDEGFNLTAFYQDFDKDGYGNKNVKKLACVAPPGYIVDSNDCNDRNSATFPGAPELCDGLDNDCNGIIDDGLFLQTFYRDKDKDGYGDVATKVEACVVPPGYVTDSADCNDSKPTVYPGAPEICDALDNNCDGNIDEGFAVTYYYFDTDKDGFGNRAAKKLSCSQPKGYVTDSTDCNDLNATVFPGAQELCDGLDNDCDGIIDDGLLSLQTFYRDKDADGYGDVAAKVLACIVPPGYVTNSADCNDSKATVFPGAPEICDGFDNNCDGDTDEGFATTYYYYDYDKDGFGNRAVKKLSCFQPKGYVTDSTDCNDLNKTVYPGAVELCDGLDNNCDKNVDEGFNLTSFYQDFDKDGYGNKNVKKLACVAPPGFVADNTDCDDYYINVHPGDRGKCDSLLTRTYDTILNRQDVAHTTKFTHRNEGLLSLYPNPSSGYFTVDYQSPIEGKMQLNVFDLTGRLVYSNNKFVAKGKNVYQVDLKNVSSGNYLLELIMLDEINRKKFVIQK